jgi:hypothetical protein
MPLFVGFPLRQLLAESESDENGNGNGNENEMNKANRNIPVSVDLHNIGQWEESSITHPVNGM